MTTDERRRTGTGRPVGTAHDAAALRVTVNGRARATRAGTTVAAIVTELAGGTPRGVAVAVNGEVVPRTAWPATVLSDGDSVEVVTAVQGG